MDAQLVNLDGFAVEDPDRLVLVDVRTGRIRRTVPLPSSARHVGRARWGGPGRGPCAGCTAGPSAASKPTTTSLPSLPAALMACRAPRIGGPQAP